MVIQDLCYAKNVIIQLVWGDQMIEFDTDVFDRDDAGVYVTPYLHNGQPLVMDIEPISGVICNVFANNPEDNKRISWRNIELHTVQKKGETAYFLKTNSYNILAKLDERRKEDRIVITKRGTVWDEKRNDFVEIRIHDISNKGISFYAPTSFSPTSNIMRVSFQDLVNGDIFSFDLNCKVLRTRRQAGNIFYGCVLMENNQDYFLYGCLKKMT